MDGGFIFDASKGQTPEQLARRREIAQALISRQLGQTPKNLGEGLSAIGQALLYRKQMSDIGGAQDANAAYEKNFLSGLTGGGDAATPAPAAPVPSFTGAQAGGDANATFSAYAPKVISQLSQDFNLSPEQAAGVVGQLGHESEGLQAINERNPTVPGSRGGFGWAQWTGPRRKEFEAFSAAKGLDPTSPEANYAFLANELNGSEGKVLDSVRAAPDAISAGRIFTDGFLRPGTPNYASRDNWTKKALAYAGPAESAPAPVGIALPQAMQAAPQVGSGEVLPEINVPTQASAPVPMPPVRPQMPQQALPQAMPVGLQRPDQPMPQAAPPQAQPNGAAVMAGFGGGAPVATAPSLGLFSGGSPAHGGGQPIRMAQNGPVAAPAPEQAGPAPAPVSPIQSVAAALGDAPQRSAGGPSSQQLISAMTDPRLSPQAKAVAQALYEQQQKQSDPMRQLQMQKLQRELATPSGTADWSKLDDGRLFNQRTGETKDVPGTDAGGPFKGTSVEAQSLNGLIKSGALTTDQAQQLGAGKTITGPNGEIIFLTPQGIFSKAGNGPAQPMGGGAGAPAQGNITLTAPKVSNEEKNAMTYADRMITSGGIIDSMGSKGSGQGDRIANAIPGVGSYFTSDDFKKIDQAKRDFVNAQLRRESGAAISSSEFENAEKQYFPQPNDTPEVIEQKRRNRELVINGMKRDGGPTYKPPAASKPDDPLGIR